MKYLIWLVLSLSLWGQSGVHIGSGAHVGSGVHIGKASFVPLQAPLIQANAIYGSGTAFTVSFLQAQTAGNTNILVAGKICSTSACTYPPDGYITDIHDDAGNTYTSITNSQVTNTGLRETFYIAKDIKSWAPGNVVHIGYNGQIVADLRILEFSNLDTADPCERSAGNCLVSLKTGLGSGIISTDDFDTLTADDLILTAGMGDGSGFSGAGSDYATDWINSDTGSLAEHLVAKTVGTYRGQGVLGPDSQNWILHSIVLKAKSGIDVYDPPSITGLDTIRGPAAGGTVVVITGTGFRPGATVTFGGAAATAVTLNSLTQITSTTPAHAAGIVDVAVANSDNQTDVQNGGFTYGKLLTVNLNGSGSVYSNPAGINCGSVCSYYYPETGTGSTVSLTASPGTGYIFDHWAGDCTGSICSLNMGADHTVTAYFLIQAGNTVDYWVAASNSSDTNDGSQAHPWATLLHASTALTLQSGKTTVVHVLAGNYAAPTTQRAGTSTSRITYQCQSLWQCYIVGHWAQYGDYVDMVDFDMKGDEACVRVAGNFDHLTHNRIHDCGVPPYTGAHSGAVVTGIGPHDILFDRNIIDNTGQWGGYADAAGTSNHGIYLDAYHSIITNNLISNTAGDGVHNAGSCQNVISNNTIFHTWGNGILTGQSNATACNGVNDYNSINNNLIVHSSFGLGNKNGIATGIPPAPIRFRSIGSATHQQVNNNLLVANYSSSGSTDNNKIMVDSNTPWTAGKYLNSSDCVAPANCAGLTMTGNINGGTSVSGFVNYSDYGAWSVDTVQIRNNGRTGPSGYHRSIGAAGLNGGLSPSEHCTGSPGYSAPCGTTTDFDGNTRPKSSIYDIGAFEDQ